LAQLRYSSNMHVRLLTITVTRALLAESVVAISRHGHMHKLQMEIAGGATAYMRPQEENGKESLLDDFAGEEWEITEIRVEHIQKTESAFIRSQNSSASLGVEEYQGLSLYPAYDACPSTEGSDWFKALPKEVLAKTADDAKFVTGCMTRPDGQMTQLAALPKRDATRPYLIWTAGFHLQAETSFTNCSATQTDCNQLASLVSRGDFLFTSFDNREYATHLAEAKPLPGPTFSPPKGLGAASGTELHQFKYFMSFQGTIKEGPRAELKSAYDRDPNLRENLSSWVVVLKQGEPYGNTPSYEDLLKQTAFTIVPRGDGRWNYRFSEALQFGSVPVVMADGLTLPYAEIVNWTDAVLFRNESMASDPRALHKSLPQNTTIIEQMRRRALEIHQQYFETVEKRALAGLKSASILAKPGPETALLKD